MRLGLATSKRYQGRGLDFEDLCQEIALALHKAALHFDSSKGKFSTFATGVIGNHLYDKSHTAKGLSDHYARRIEEFRAAEMSLACYQNQPPTEAETFARLRAQLHWTQETCDAVRAVLRAANPVPLSAHEETRENFVADPSPDPPSQADSQESLERLRAAITPLPEDERDLIMHDNIQDLSAEDRESLARLLAAIARLPEAERQIIVRHNFQHLSHAQVGERLGLSEDQVRRRHNKIRDALKRELGTAPAPGQSRELA